MTKRQKKMLYRLLLSGLFYGIGVFFRSGLKIEWLELLFLFGAYLLAGYDVLIESCQQYKKWASI